MSIWKNGKLIAGGRQTMPLLSFMWADHQLNDISWLRADTYSWQSGAVYQAAYAHLVLDIDGKTLQSETIDGITVQFYLADDGHKICPDSEESNVAAIYTATGVAWYYIIDTTNQRFKLPRTQFGLVGLRDIVGKYVPESLPNITGAFWIDSYHAASPDGAFTATDNYSAPNHGNWASEGWRIHLDASRSSSAYQDGAPVQQRATQMYLYFYVGTFTQTALENTAGIVSEDFNELNQHKVIAFQAPTADNNYTWYRLYADGWVEQGGTLQTAANSLTFPVEMADTNYQWYANPVPQDFGNFRKLAATRATTGLTNLSNIFGTSAAHNSEAVWEAGTFWEVKGMAA